MMWFLFLDVVIIKTSKELYSISRLGFELHGLHWLLMIVIVEIDNPFNQVWRVYESHD